MSRLSSLGIRDVQVKFFKQKGTSLAKNVLYVWWIFFMSEQSEGESNNTKETRDSAVAEGPRVSYE